jgi:hypothetical protein
MCQAIVRCRAITTARGRRIFKHTLALCGGIWLVLVVVGLRTEDRVPEPEAVRSGGALRELTKEVAGIHALLTRSPFGGDILRSFVWRVSLAKATFASSQY